VRIYGGEHGVRSGLTNKLTHEGRQEDIQLANQHSAALIVCSAWFGVAERPHAALPVPGPVRTRDDVRP
jgi:uncharacterized membrane protein (UPF0136 family)